jgi:hypothetical protein
MSQSTEIELLSKDLVVEAFNNENDEFNKYLSEMPY